MPNHRLARYLRTLDAIKALRERNGYPPTLREIKDAAGLSSTSVASYHVDRLEELVYLKTYPGIARGIVVKGQPSDHHRRTAMRHRHRHGAPIDATALGN